LFPINILKGGLKMGTQQLQKHLDSFLKWTDRNTPTILTTLGVIGLLQTGIMAYKAGPKGEAIVEAKKQDLRDCAPGDKEAKRAVYGELVKEMTPVVAPPVVKPTNCSNIGCLQFDRNGFAGLQRENRTITWRKEESKYQRGTRQGQSCSKSTKRTGQQSGDSDW
jgi:hypothetical protein